MRLFFLFSLLMTPLIFGCNRPDPNPELKDPIYLDIQKELRDVQLAIAAEQKTLDEHKKTLSEVVPQTGQIKYATKRVYESQARLDKLRQIYRFWEVRLESRAKESQRKYKIAYSNDSPWPDQKEWEDYKATRKSQQKPRQWTLDNRFNELGLKRDSGTTLPSAEPNTTGEGAK